MKFSILIVNYNGGTARMARCMAALAAQTITDFEVLLVDNGSVDGSADTPVPDARFRWIKAGKNLGFAAGNNLAAREAKGEWLFMNNPDAYPEPDMLAKLLSATIRHPDCFLFGCTQLDDKSPEIMDGSGDCYFFAGLPWRGGKDWPVETLPDEGEVWGPCGAATLIRKDLFDKLGGYDEDFFCYCEDVDLNFRARLLGYHAIQVVEAMIRHEGSGISGVKSYFPIFHGTRNCLWVFVKDMPGILFYLLLPFHITVQLLLFSDIKTFKPRWEGLVAGIKGLPLIWKKRQQVQKTRAASVIQIAKALTWNPATLYWRKADVRPLQKR